MHARPPRFPLSTRVVLAALLAAWPGCAHIPEVEQPDPGFTFESLRKGGVANLGVVQPDEITPPPGPVTHAFEKVMAIMCRDVPVVESARTRAAMDGSTVRFVLASYQMQGTPESPWLARAADSLRDEARYLALVRVESNSIKYGTHAPPPPAPSKNASAADTVRVSAEGSVRATTRDVTIAVDLYDLETKKLAFHGSYFGSAVSTDRDSLSAPRPVGGELPSATGRTKVGIATIDIVPSQHPVAGDYPLPPPLEQALEAAYLEFVRSIPGAPPGK